MSNLKNLLTSAQKAYKAGDYEAALDCCKRAIRTEEGERSALVHLTFAAVFTAQEEPEMAERAFGSALELDPDNGQAWKGMAALLEAYGAERADELLAAYQKLAELAAAGKLKGKASEWESKVKAAQASLGLCSIDDAAEEGEGAERGGRAARGRGGGGRGGRAAANPPIVESGAAAVRARRGGGGGGSGAKGDTEGGGGAEGGGGGDGDGGGGDESEGGAMAAAREELAELRAKVAAGTKLSGKQKRGLKRLEEAEERWKSYEAAEDPSEDTIGSQFVAEQRGSASRGAAPGAVMGDGIEVPEFSIRADNVELFVDARLSLRTATWCKVPNNIHMKVPPFRTTACSPGRLGRTAWGPGCSTHSGGLPQPPRPQLELVARLSARAKAADVTVFDPLGTGRRYGLVAPNGKGKTTLLKHIAARGLRGIPPTLDALYVEQEVRAGAESAVDALLASDKRRGALLAEEARLEAELEEQAAVEEGGGMAAATDEAAAATAAALVAVYDELELLGSEAAEGRARALLAGLGFDAGKQDGPTSQLSGGWRMRLALARGLVPRALP